MKNKIVMFRTKNIHSSLSILIALMSFLAINMFSLHAIAPPVELRLNTIIEPVATFVLDETDVEITLGTPYTVGYTLTGNVPLKLKITSDNAVGNNFYMVHENSSISDKILYVLKFDYGNNILSTVSPDNFVNMITNNYNDGELRIETLADAGDSITEGEYSDTITFIFESQ